VTDFAQRTIDLARQNVAEGGRPPIRDSDLDLLPALKGRDSDWAAHAAQPWCSLSRAHLAVPTPCGVAPGPGVGAGLARAKTI
jgi:hypothetical protein